MDETNTTCVIRRETLRLLRQLATLERRTTPSELDHIVAAYIDQLGLGGKLKNVYPTVITLDVVPNEDRTPT